MARLGRMNGELNILKSATLTGISAWTVDDNLFHLEAQIVGNDDSPYRGGIFKLEIRIPDRYPFEPPHIKFITPIYHPNIDTSGRICLDVLKMPPKGDWKPSNNIRTVLLSIQSLMNEPNPDDPLMEDISRQYKMDRRQFRETAENWTERHAKQKFRDDEEDHHLEEEEQPSGKGTAKSDVNSKTKLGKENFSTTTNASSKEASSNASSIASSSKVATSSHIVTAEKAKIRDDDPFEDSFESVDKTPEKKTPEKKTKDDSISDMNDSDFDLFDFEESPNPKKRKILL